MTNLDIWKKCGEFHGHTCGGLAIGFKASMYAKELLGLGFSDDEQIVCVTENDACGVDAIQVALGCSAGKGNLIFRMRGKQAFSFFCRKTSKSVRLVLNQLPEMEREEKKDYILNASFSDLFTVKEVEFELPEVARIFKSVVCEKCGEVTAEPFIHLENGKKLCTDCYKSYSRFI